MKPVPLKTDRAVTAQRDDNGVPHIEASNFGDALYGLGYLHALDRGSQLLFSRSVASGQAAAEIAGDAELLETDRFLRRVGLHLRLEEDLETLRSDTRERLRHYCAGVNAGLDAVGRTWPMWATNFQARPWDEQAVVLVGRLLGFGGLAIGQMQNERLLLKLIHAGVDAAALQELFGDRIDVSLFEHLRSVKLAGNELSDDALSLLTDLPRLAGSNAWAVAPSRSATGGALLASDPHLEVHRLPAIWYEAVLKTPEGYALGATLPGCPLMASARNSRIAWGVTYLRGDTIDYFLEDCREEQGEWQYRRGEQWRPFRIRDEEIRQKTGDCESLRIYENDQGTIEHSLDRLGPGVHLSFAWAGGAVGGAKALESWLDMLEARSTEQALDIARECPLPTLCWVVADREGHIGLQACGRIPIRGAGQSGLTPVPAWDPQYHWQGWLPTSKLPRVLDPPEGFLATANEEWSVDGLRLVTQPAADYRQRRILQRLGEADAATVEDMQRLQYDLVSVQAQDLLALILPHLLDGPLKERLTNWDCRYTPESVEASLFTRLYWRLLLELLGTERGIGWRRFVYLCTRTGYSLMFLTAADRLLQREHSVWWRQTEKGELIRRAAARVDVASAEPWSQVNNFHFTDRFFGKQQVGRLLGFNSRRHAMPGCHATVFQGHVLQTAKREATFAPSYHFVTDLSTDEAWTNLPGGPNENRFSRWYKSDVARWLSGEYKQLAPQP